MAEDPRLSRPARSSRRRSCISSGRRARTHICTESRRSPAAASSACRRPPPPPSWRSRRRRRRRSRLWVSLPPACRRCRTMPVRPSDHLPAGSNHARHAILVISHLVIICNSKWVGAYGEFAEASDGRGRASQVLCGLRRVTPAQMFPGRLRVAIVFVNGDDADAHSALLNLDKAAAACAAVGLGVFDAVADVVPHSCAGPT